LRFKSLAELKRPPRGETVLAALPDKIRMAHYAKQKAFKINELVRSIYQDSYEWYGYTLARRDDPELIVDLGLPRNEQNILQYTRVHPEKIAAYQESLPADYLINGWIHSHGNLDLKQFSEIDAENQVTVLDYVTAGLRRPLAKREIVINEAALLVKGDFTDADLHQGSVTIITDRPVSEVRILETVYGVFCYSIVIGDDGWHHQEIYYKKRGILSGQTTVSQKDSEIVLVDTGRVLTEADIAELTAEVKEKIHPETYTSPKMESM
jgi:hypothetical protein